MEYYLAIEKNEIDLEIIKLSEMSDKDKYDTISLIHRI